MAINNPLSVAFNAMEMPCATAVLSPKPPWLNPPNRVLRQLIVPTSPSSGAMPTADGAASLVFVGGRGMDQGVASSECVLHSCGATREGRGLLDRPLTKEGLQLAHVGFQDPNAGDVSVRMQSELDNRLSREGEA